MRKARETNRLLIISPFDDGVKYVTQKTANKRNEIMLNIADEIFIAYYPQNGNLSELMKELTEKKISRFKDSEELGSGVTN